MMYGLEMAELRKRLGVELRESLRWFGHVQKRDVGYTELRVLKMELPGRREDSWIETDDLLWRSLKRTAERRGKDM